MELINKLKANKITISKLILFIILILIIGVKYDQNLDIYFMINHGRYILQNGFTNIEPFTVHEGFNFQFEKWLTCVVSWLAYNKFGLFGLNIIMLILMLITYILIFKISNYVSNRNNFIIPFLTCFLYIIFAQKRPSLISNICLLIEFYFLEKYCREDNIKNLYILPILSIIIMNTHSTMFPVFYMVIFPFLFSDMEITSRLKLNKDINFNKSIKIIIFSLLSFVTSLINPFTYKSYIYMYESYTSGLNPYVTELAKITITEWLFILIVIPIILLVVKMLKDDVIIPTRYLVLFIVFLLFALYALRNYQYYLLFSCIVLTYLYDINNLKFITYIQFMCILWSIFILFVNANSDNIYNYNLFNGLGDNLHIIDGLQVNGDEKVFVTNEGSYFEFKGLKSYMDTRLELFSEKVNHKKNILAEHKNILYGLYSIDEIQEIYDFDIYYIDKLTSLYNKLLESEFIKVAETDEVAIFSRKAPKDYILVGKYNGNIYDVDLFNEENAQKLLDEENTCARSELKSGAILLADHGYQYFSETQVKDKLYLWNKDGKLTTYKKIDTKISNKGEWITEDNINVYTDYISELVTQVCGNDKIEWNFWEKESVND